VALCLHASAGRHDACCDRRGGNTGVTNVARLLSGAHPSSCIRIPSRCRRTPSPP
jgi:hypothetical protein